MRSCLRTLSHCLSSQAYNEVSDDAVHLRVDLSFVRAIKGSLGTALTSNLQAGELGTTELCTFTAVEQCAPCRRWTQWIFLQLFKRGLAYQAEVPVNWCPALGTVLANEEVIGASQPVVSACCTEPLLCRRCCADHYAKRDADCRLWW